MIGDRIKELRKDAGLSQAELSRKLSITRSSVNAWESGFSAPTAQYIIEMAALFHCTSDYLLGIEHDKTLNISNFNDKERGIIVELAAYFDEKDKNTISKID